VIGAGDLDCENRPFGPRPSTEKKMGGYYNWLSRDMREQSGKILDTPPTPRFFFYQGLSLLRHIGTGLLAAGNSKYGLRYQGGVT